jgi:hypothetical protein
LIESVVIVAATLDSACRFIPGRLSYRERRPEQRHARLFAWGYSSEGFMANGIGCQRADVFRGIGVWITHDQDDMTVPISYGTSVRDAGLQTDGCAPTTAATEPSPCVAYDGWSAGHPVVLCNPATPVTIHLATPGKA